MAITRRFFLGSTATLAGACTLGPAPGGEVMDAFLEGFDPTYGDSNYRLCRWKEYNDYGYNRASTYAQRITSVDPRKLNDFNIQDIIDIAQGKISGGLTYEASRKQAIDAEKDLIGISKAHIERYIEIQNWYDYPTRPERSAIIRGLPHQSEEQIINKYLERASIDTESIEQAQQLCARMGIDIHSKSNCGIEEQLEKFQYTLAWSTTDVASARKILDGPVPHYVVNPIYNRESGCEKR